MLRVGVVGTGTMGADHVRTLSTVVPGAGVVAVSDADLRRARRVADAVGGCRALREPLDLIRDEEVDAVVVASPDVTHEAFVLACLEARKPVLCEKPLAPTPEACLRLVEAEAALDRPYIQVGFMRRFDPAYVEMKRALDADSVGHPLLVHCFHRNAETPPSYTSEMLITSSAAHEIDAIRWLLGQEVASATVRLPRASGLAPSGLRDPQLIILETDHGVLVDVEVFVNAGYGYDVGCEVVGETGTVSLLPPAVLSTRGAGRESRSVPQDWRDRFAAAYRTELQAWVDATVAGTSRGANAWDGYAATACARACLDSLAGGGPAPVELAGRPPFYGG